VHAILIIHSVAIGGRSLPRDDLLPAERGLDDALHLPRIGSPSHVGVRILRRHQGCQDSLSVEEMVGTIDQIRKQLFEDLPLSIVKRPFDGLDAEDPASAIEDIISPDE
jgi:hypothetical protein